MLPCQNGHCAQPQWPPCLLAEQHMPLQPVTCGTSCPSRWIGLGPWATQHEKVPQLASPRQHIIGTTDFLQVYLLVPFLGTTVFFNPFSLLLTDRLFQVDVTICLLRLFFLTSSFILSPAPILGSADICHPACFYFYYWKGKKEIMCFPLTPAQPALDIVYTDVILPRRKLLRGWS